VYKGTWNNGCLEGMAKVSYSDGLEYEGLWIEDYPTYDAVHPLVKECIEKGICTDTIPGMPQWMYGVISPYCVSCAGPRVDDPIWQHSSPGCRTQKLKKANHNGEYMITYEHGMNEFRHTIASKNTNK
jgi:hypothetical protein